MNTEDEILINKYGQNLVASSQIQDRFVSLNNEAKRSFLNDVLHLIMQSKPVESDIESAIQNSELKTTATPCVLLRKGVSNHNLQKIIELPENELGKALILLLSLFRIAYLRRYEVERNAPNKWWYWDLSDEKNVNKIK